MTVSSELNRKEYAGNGVTVAFATSPVVFFDEADLEVYVVVDATGVATLKTISTHYTVSGGDGAVGTVTMLTAPATGETLVIVRNLSLVQEVDLVNNDSSDAEVIEDALDKLTMMAQQNSARLDRSFTLADSDTSGASLTLPVPTADNLIGWNSDATALENYPDIVPSAEAAAAAAVSAAAALASEIAAEAAQVAAEAAAAAAAVGNLTVNEFTGDGSDTTFTLSVTPSSETNTQVYLSGVYQEKSEYTVVGTTLTFSTAPANGVSIEVVIGGVQDIGTPSDGTVTLAKLADMSLGLGQSIINGYLSWSVSGSVLTVALKTLAGADPSSADPVKIVFRSVTATDGAPVVRTITAATSIAINDTATLGTTNSIAFRLWAVAFDDGGTVRLGLINCRSSLNVYPLAGWGIASATAEDNASDSAHVFYAGAAVSSKAYATLGYGTWESGLATAGTWSAAPTRAQLFGLGVSLPGQLVQAQRTETGAATTGTTIIPADDTIPQITEGDEYLSQAITPVSAANLLHVSAQLWLSNNVVGPHNIMAALFQDSTANALVSTIQTNHAASYQCSMWLSHRKLAGTTSALTMRVRAGGGNPGTTGINGLPGNRIHGGVANSFLEVQEIMA
jgi:hypothetical protein